jgi:hypothetical protein
MSRTELSTEQNGTEQNRAEHGLNPKLEPEPEAMRIRGEPRTGHEPRSCGLIVTQTSFNFLKNMYIHFNRIHYNETF